MQIYMQPQNHTKTRRKMNPSLQEKTRFIKYKEHFNDMPDWMRTARRGNCLNSSQRPSPMWLNVYYTLSNLFKIDMRTTQHFGFHHFGMVGAILVELLLNPLISVHNVLFSLQLLPWQVPGLAEVNSKRQCICTMLNEQNFPSDLQKKIYVVHCCGVCKLGPAPRSFSSCVTGELCPLVSISYIRMGCGAPSSRPVSRDVRFALNHHHGFQAQVCVFQAAKQRGVEPSLSAMFNTSME